MKTLTLKEKDKDGDHILFPRENKNLYICLPTVKLGSNYPWIVDDKKEKWKVGNGRCIYLKEEHVARGEHLIANYRLFKLISGSKQVPEVKFMSGDGLAGTGTLKSISKFYKDYLDFVEEDSWKLSLDGYNRKYKKNPQKYFSRKTGLQEEKMNEIMVSYPLDDNQEEIKESDLVKLILK